MKNMLSTRADVWTRYWSGGTMHSCAGSYDDAYSGSIGCFWRDGFLTLPEGARVLDLASGNGPLARLLLSLDERSDLHCDAVDLARPTPTWLQQLPSEKQGRVRFHPGCAVERLPFADASFDAAVSQWGFEYSDLSLSVPELLRVMKPGGQGQLLLHHEQALPVLLAAEEIEHIKWLKQPEGYLATASLLIAPMALAATVEGRQQLRTDIAANLLRERMNALQDILSARVAEGSCPDVLHDVRANVSQLFVLAAQQGVPDTLAAWHRLSLGLDDAVLRLEELRACALGSPAAHALAQRLAPHGSYALTVLEDRGAIMGWGLKFNRAS